MMAFTQASAATLLVIALAAPANDIGSRKATENHSSYRRAVAVIGVYGYSTDSTGADLDATRNHYALHFSQDQLPSVNAIWSITLYELPEGLLYANPINRYRIHSSMLSGLKHDGDGGLTIYVQHESPGTARESNWLPAPAGPFRLAMRLYCAKSDALGEKWKSPPPLERIEPVTAISSIRHSAVAATP